MEIWRLRSLVFVVRFWEEVTAKQRSVGWVGERVQYCVLAAEKPGALAARRSEDQESFILTASSTK